MPSPVYRSHDEDQDASGALSFAAPSGVADDDILLCMCVFEGGSDEDVTPPGGDGWVLADEANDSTNIGIEVYWKVASSESWPKAFTVSNNKKGAGALYAFSGGDITDVIEGISNNNGNSSTGTMNAITNNRINTLLVFFAGNKKNSSYSNWSGSMTERHDSTGVGGTASNAGADEDVSGTGSTGTRTVDISDSESWVTVGVSLNSPTTRRIFITST